MAEKCRRTSDSFAWCWPKELLALLQQGHFDDEIAKEAKRRTIMNKNLRGQLWQYLLQDVCNDYEHEAWGADGNAAVLVISMISWTRIFGSVDPAPERRPQE